MAYTHIVRVRTRDIVEYKIENRADYFVIVKQLAFPRDLLETRGRS